MKQTKISLQLPVEDLKALKKLAKSEERTLSQEVRRLITQRLREPKEPVAT